MAATNAPLAFGGMTQHCWRWGWRMFFLVPAQSSSRWRDRQFAVPRPFSQQPQGPARASLGRFGTSQRNQFGFFLAVKNPCNRRSPPLLAAQHSLEAFFHQLLPDPVNHRCAGLQRLDNPLVTPAFTASDTSAFNNVAFSSPLAALPLHQRFELLTFLTAQPHNILFTEISFAAMIASAAFRCDQSKSQNSCPCKLIEASD